MILPQVCSNFSPNSVKKSRLMRPSDLASHAISLYLDLRRFTLRTQPFMHAIAAQKEDCEQALSSRVDLVLNDLPHSQVPGSLNISWEQAISELTTINSAQKDLLSAMVLDLRRRPI